MVTLSYGGRKIPTSVARKSIKIRESVMFKVIKVLTVAFTLAVVLGSEIFAGNDHLLPRLSIWDLLHVLVAVLHFASTAIFV
jgi:hypothetical protein